MYAHKIEWFSLQKACDGDWMKLKLEKNHSSGKKALDAGH